MSNIIQFPGNKKVSNDSAVSDKERYKAMAKGTYKSFTCKTCGSKVEVVGNNKPTKCSGCGRKIRW